MIDPRTIKADDLVRVYNFTVAMGFDPGHLSLHDSVHLVEANRAAADHPTNEIDEGLTADINTLLEPLR